jgi:acetamidase/formamidase
MAMHVIEPLRETLHSTFSRDLPPALTIDSEDTVVFSTLEAGWGLEPSRENGERRRFEDFRPEWRGDGHALCGPVEVRGARHDSGDTHRRAVDRNLGQDGFRGTYPEESNQRLGVAARRARPSPDPSATGGNVDCEELVPGSSLFLPIAALLSTGDGHAAQGDGEVGQTAIEWPVEHAVFSFYLHEDLRWSTLRTHG